MPTYRAYGLTIQSDIELALPIGEGRLDVVLEQMQLTLPAPRDAGLSVTVPGVVDFLASEGNRVGYSPAPDADPAALARALVGAVMGVVLQQRGHLVIHASVIDVNGSAALFTGPSGAGKSTLAEGFRRRGFPVLSDDLAVIDERQSGAPVALPTVPVIRLREGNELANPNYARSGAGDSKLALPIGEAGPVPVGAIYSLQVGSSLDIHSMSDREAFGVLTAFTRANTMLEDSPVHAARHLRMCGALLAHAAVGRLERPHDYDRLDEVIDLVVARHPR